MKQAAEGDKYYLLIGGLCAESQGFIYAIRRYMEIMGRYATFSFISLFSDNYPLSIR